MQRCPQDDGRGETPVCVEALKQVSRVAPAAEPSWLKVAPRRLARVTAPAATVALLLAVALAGCASTVPAAFSPPAGAARVADVPFFPQLDYQCGPASLAGVLNYYGKRISPEEIAQAIFRENIRGTVTLDMLLYAREQGFAARWSSATVGDIVQAVDERVPLIVMVDYGFSVISRNHYMVVVGYDPKGILANSGPSRETHISWNDFLPTWERAKCWALRIEPKNSTKTG
jgi:hypothetical protein